MATFSPAYQVVVLAGGRGSRMTDLTCTIPKCLLPVANIPMIIYPLIMVQTAGFSEVLILAPSKYWKDLRRILGQHYILLKLDFVDVPDEQDLGTAEALQLALHKITKSVLIVSCDFICDFPLTKFVDWHQANDGHASLLLSRQAIQGNAPGPKVKRKTERDLFAIQPTTNRVAFMAGETDIEDDVLSLHKNLLLKFPNLEFSTKLLDCHMYLIEKQLLELLTLLPNEFVSLKTDLLPFIIKLQHATYLSLPKDIQTLLRQMLRKDSAQSNCVDVKCSAYVMNNDEFSICARLNNVGSYFETNKQVLKSLPKIFADPQLSALIQSHPCTGAQVGNDSFIGTGTTSGRKTQVKRSIVGKQCSLGENCKLNNCVIMDHVHIADGSSLANCIVCHSSEIAEKCDLKDCLLGTNRRVYAGAKCVAEIIGGSEAGQMMEI